MDTERTASRAGDYQLVIERGEEIESLHEDVKAEKARAEEAERKLQICQGILTAAVEYEEAAFDADCEISGGELLDWFANWRADAFAALDGERVKLPPPSEPLREAARLALAALAARNNTGRRLKSRDEQAADALARALVPS